MGKRIRLSVRHGTSGRIIAFIYYDWETACDPESPINAVDDGHTLTTGLAIPFEYESLRQFLECECLTIDDSQPKIFEF
jgi:hypothetical protein